MSSLSQWMTWPSTLWAQSYPKSRSHLWLLPSKPICYQIPKLGLHGRSQIYPHLSKPLLHFIFFIAIILMRIVVINIIIILLCCPFFPTRMQTPREQGFYLCCSFSNCKGLKTLTYNRCSLITIDWLGIAIQVKVVIILPWIFALATPYSYSYTFKAILHIGNKMNSSMVTGGLTETFALTLEKA